ncbi:MAG: CDP-alcohol phosphatidyltransferase family protein [Ignavibacteria bacterium]|nr:CDP-alcohol phosphatidyltransferase family protein [Ignavibacteria bacterium]
MINQRDIFLLPNLISAVRIILLIPVSYLLLTDFEGQNTLIIILVLCMYLSDLLDGFLARKMNLVSESGKIIDPLADKISVTVIALILLYLGKIPLWFVAVVVLRDILISVFGIYLDRKKDIRLMSNTAGKIAVFSIGLIILFAVINSQLSLKINTYLYFVSLILILFSSFLYYKRFRQTVKQK